MALAFGKSINVVSGFDLGAKVPVDTRYVVATTADRDAHVTNGRAYAGMLVYVEADSTIYKYTGSEWVAFGTTQATTVTVDGDEAGDIVETNFTVGSSATSSVTLALKEILTAGTGCKVTVNAKGLVTAIDSLAATDIPTITLSKISDAGTAAALDAGTSAGNVLLLDANGKIADSCLPALAVTEVYVVESEAAMLALNAQPGDIAIRNDESKTYILRVAGASTLGNWSELKSPADAVSSVNGKTGTVVLGTDDIAEGLTNLYYTETRATNNFTTNFALASSTSLADTANIWYHGDTIPATDIGDDTTHRFVTDTQITRWESLKNITVGSTPSSTDIAAMQTGDFYFEVEASA